MTDRYVVRYVSGFTEEIEAIDPKPDNFDGGWRVWLLDYPNASGPVSPPIRKVKMTINMATVEKVQEVVT